MKKSLLISATCLLMVLQQLSAQEYVLSCSRWSDMVNRSTRNTSSTIGIDSSLITISQGPTNLYLEITKQSRKENIFTYEVIDPNDQAATATFSPEEMTFDYRAGQYWLRYFIETIQRPEKENVSETPKDTSNNLNDTAAVVEDTKIYETATVMPEYPGGKEAMESFIAQNLKYPAAAKKNNLKGIVTVSAVVEKDGSLSEVKVKKDIGGDCGSEAVRVVKLMPTWIPGQIKNEDKRVRMSISIFFPAK
ncbi:MAG: energy transducer TonB [Chitinophagaceae bacterium]|nr:energy transducer TonB [Chitinophagaceae bacterium]